MISKACFKGFAACWTIVCCPIVVLWHPSEMPVFGCFGVVALGFSVLFAKLFGVLLGRVCAG